MLRTQTLLIFYLTITILTSTLASTVKPIQDRDTYGGRYSPRPRRPFSYGIYGLQGHAYGYGSSRYGGHHGYGGEHGGGHENYGRYKGYGGMNSGHNDGYGYRGMNHGHYGGYGDQGGYRSHDMYDEYRGRRYRGYEGYHGGRGSRGYGYHHDDYMYQPMYHGYW